MLGPGQDKSILPPCSELLWDLLPGSWGLVLLPQLLPGLQLHPGLRCLNPGRDYYLSLGEEEEFLGDQ